jgi:hypothetical protein
MHAVVVNVTINDRQAADRTLREQLVPRVPTGWALATDGAPVKRTVARPG